MVKALVCDCRGVEMLLRAATVANGMWFMALHSASYLGHHYVDVARILIESWPAGLLKYTSLEGVSVLRQQSC